MKKIKYILPFLVVALFFFNIACKLTEEAVEEPLIQAVKGPLKTEKEIELEYLFNLENLAIRIAVTGKKMSQASSDTADGQISISEYKIIVQEYISEINSCHSIYLELKPSERLEKPHELYGKAMEHFLNGSKYYQQLIDTDDIRDMNKYLQQATSEVNLGNEYLYMATEEFEKLIE